MNPEDNNGGDGERESSEPEDRSDCSSSEDRLRVFRNRVLRKVFGPTRDEIMEEWG